MSNYQLIALDMDGTLLDSRKQISPATLAALQRAVDAGKHIVLSTGRCRPELADYTRLVPGIRYLICTSGALVYDRQEHKALYRKPLDCDTVKNLLDLARQEGAMVHLLDAASIVQRDQMQHMDRYGMGVYQPMFKQVSTPWEDLYETYCAAPFPVEKVNLYHTSQPSRERTKARIQQMGLPVHQVNAESASLELSAAGVDKGTGLRQLCAQLGLPLEQTIAVGDADNDRTILAAAGLSVAMGNALPHIKQLADIETADCDHDGCAAVIDTYLLG